MCILHQYEAVNCFCPPQGHGPFSHVFDGRFIPAVKGPDEDEWKVSLFSTYLFSFK